MRFRALIQGFKLFDQAEIPLRLEVQRENQEQWVSVFRDDKFELINLFLDPEGLLRLSINNMLFEFLERPDDQVVLAQIHRFVWVRAIVSHERYRFRIHQVAPEQKTLFTSEWNKGFEA